MDYNALAIWLSIIIMGNVLNYTLSVIMYEMPSKRTLEDIYKKLEESNNLLASILKELKK